VLACCAAAAVLVLAGCGSDGHDDAGTSSATSAISAPRGESLDPQHPVVAIDTNLGAIRVRLDAVNAPGTVGNFLNYVNDGFYSDTLIHYVAADKMILGGGYSAVGQPKVPVNTVRNEAHNGLKNVRGTIAMARDVSAGIDSATSQFFINLADAASFDHRGEEVDEYGYCVFGEVVDGLEVAEQISRSTTRDQGGDLTQSPVPPVVIKSIREVE
jgi:peptidyl-prolyl cis-trans isomerase B (cyclophilin B)